MNDKLISEAYIYILITCTCLVILGLIYECEVYKIKKMIATILLAIAFVYGLYGFFNIFTT